MNNIYHAALQYAQLGWHVIPLVPWGKRPAIENWPERASVDPGQLAAWFDNDRGFNLGVVCGLKSGINVVDVDVQNNGDHTWEAMIGGDDTWYRDAPRQTTASGGYHIILDYEPDMGTKGPVGIGVDLQSNGSYIVAAPSRVDPSTLKDTAQGDGCYTFDDDLSPFDDDIDFNVKIPNGIKMHMRSYKKKVKEKAEHGNQEVIGAGERNDVFTIMAGKARRLLNCDAESLFGLLSPINQQRCEIPLSPEELMTICNSVASYQDHDVDPNLARVRGEQFALSLKQQNLLDFEAQGDHDDGYIKFTSAWDLIQDRTPTKYIIEDVIPAASVGMIYGGSGSGKTMSVIDMSLSIATGQHWGGKEIESPGNVVYLAGEGNTEIGKRFQAWYQEKCLQGDSSLLSRIFVSSAGVDLDSDGEAARLMHQIGRYTALDELSLIVVDTLNRNMAGDENSATEVRKLINACKAMADETGAAVMIIHHTGHKGEGRARGSSALRASMDYCYAVTRDEKTKVVTIANTKMKDGPAPDSFDGAILGTGLGYDRKPGIEQTGGYFSVGAEPVIEADVSGLVDNLSLSEDELKIVKYWDILAHAWYFGKCQRDFAGHPIIERQALKNFADLNSDNYDIFATNQKVKNTLKEGRPGGLITMLSEHGLINLERDTKGTAQRFVCIDSPDLLPGFLQSFKEIIEG